MFSLDNTIANLQAVAVKENIYDTEEFFQSFLDRIDYLSPRTVEAISAIEDEALSCTTTISECISAVKPSSLYAEYTDSTRAIAGRVQQLSANDSLYQIEYSDGTVSITTPRTTYTIPGDYHEYVFDVPKPIGIFDFNLADSKNSEENLQDISQEELFDILEQ